MNANDSKWAVLLVCCAAAPAWAQALAPMDVQHQADQYVAERNHTGFGVAAGVDFGLGAAIPSLRVPSYSFGGRLGAGWRGDAFALLLFGEAGFDAAFNTGTVNGLNYGYLVRIPLGASLELIIPQSLSDRLQSEVQYHLAVAVTDDLTLATSCSPSSGQASSQGCSSVPASGYLGVSLRIGFTFAVQSQNSVGFFVIPHVTFANTPQGTNVLFTTHFAVAWQQL